MLRTDLAAFIEKNLLGPDRRLLITDETPLVEGGIIDSMGLMQMVTFLEERTGVRIPDDEVVPENFETLLAIESLVDRLRERRSSR